MEAARLAAEAAMYEEAANDSNAQHMDFSESSMMADSVGADQLALFDALQTAGELDHAALAEEMMSMGLDPTDPNSMQALIHMIAKQEQERKRPSEHYLTIAQNGMILEATKTATGFPPDALLMTSAYDAVYEEDLPGFLAVKTHFWDKGHPSVDVYLRRRTVEGAWIWLRTRAVSYVDQPIPGIILHEVLIDDEDYAVYVNRITRIAAIVVQAVEAAHVASIRGDSTEELEDDNANANEKIPGVSHIPWVADDAAAYQEMVQNAATAQGVENLEDPLEQIMRAAASSGAGETATGTPTSKLEQEIIERIGGKKREKFDPFSVMEEVREGVRLDLGMTKISVPEIKMVALALSGGLDVEEICAIIFRSLSEGLSVDDAFGRIEFPSQQLLDVPHNQPRITVVNLSYTYMGNMAMGIFSELLSMKESPLRTIDVSFCHLDESGLISLAKSLALRKSHGIAPLRGIILSGNHVCLRAATELGRALSPDQYRTSMRSTNARKASKISGYVEDSESDDEEVSDTGLSLSGGNIYASKEHGLRVLHMASASMNARTSHQFLLCLGPRCPIRELSLASNALGSQGAELLVNFLEGLGQSRKEQVLPNLDRLDLSNCCLGDEGLAKLTRAISSKRTIMHLVELRLSNNGIGASGIETMMNKLLQHNLVSLSIDKNGIGDQGCQLIAASLQSMQSLSRLNLGFNQIGSRGVNSLMRSLVACESITYLGLSGNIMKISGSVALAFTLAQHPRLEELSLDNCCLSQAAQCHIIAGIISNRWVPMKRLDGFEAGPPMVALGALKIVAQNLSNEECFRIRKDEQMKTILQWMETNRVARRSGKGPSQGTVLSEAYQHFLTPDFVQSMNDVHGIPSQNAYLRLLGWLSRIPFDEDELISLRKYFYDADGGSEDRGSDGYINLKLRGDLLAALESDVADEIRDETPMLVQYVGSVGMDMSSISLAGNVPSGWESMRGAHFDRAQRLLIADILEEDHEKRIDLAQYHNDEDIIAAKKRRMHSAEFQAADTSGIKDESLENAGGVSRSSMSTLSRQSVRSLQHSGSDRSTSSQGERRRTGGLKPRITMFPQFEMKLEELKATATEMIEQEDDPEQQEVILTQYAEASLTILRQLRYHCMNSGLDGWRQGGLKRKVLIVDDSNVTRKLVSRHFEKANFIVDTASNGAEGVEKLKKSIYDIAFMDIDMPVMNGFEATKRLREWEDAVRPGTRQPICALTAAYVDDFERSELMKFKEAGLDVMESKPCNIPRLFKVVDDVSPMFSDLSISVIQQEQGGTE